MFDGLLHEIPPAWPEQVRDGGSGLLLRKGA
jgi:hypothetical protein